MNDAPIVSHVASPEYRQHVDDMKCAVDGCKRWRIDDSIGMCADHFARYCAQEVGKRLEEDFINGEFHREQGERGAKAWIPQTSDSPKMLEDIRRGIP